MQPQSTATATDDDAQAPRHATSNVLQSSLVAKLGIYDNYTRRISTSHALQHNPNHLGRRFQGGPLAGGWMAHVVVVVQLHVVPSSGSYLAVRLQSRPEPCPPTQYAVSPVKPLAPESRRIESSGDSTGARVFVL